MPVVLQHRRSKTVLSFKDRIERSDFARVLVVVPTKRRIRHLSREVMSLLPRAVSPAFPFHTLESLANAIYRATASPRRTISGPVQTLLFHEAVRERRGSLEYFKLSGSEQQLFRGTFEKVIDVITNLKESGVYPEVLEEEINSGPSEEQQMLRDISAVYRSYDNNLESISAIDSGGLYKFFHVGCSQQQFDHAFRRVYPDVEEISLAGFDEFTVPEIGFIRKICELDRVSISLLFDFLPGNPGLFGHLEENYRRFVELGFGPLDPVSTAAQAAIALNVPRRSPAAQSAADHIASSLFQPELRGRKLDLRRDITLIKARSRKHEVETICKLIKKLNVDKPGRDLSAICVATFHPQLYTDLFREAFRKYGIPVNITDRYDLSRSPLVVAILGLLQVPVNGFRRDDVLRVARMPWFAFGVGDSALDYGNLTDVSGRLRITAGYSGWVRRIDAALEQERKREGDPGDSNGPRSLRREVQSLEKAAADVELIGGLLAGFSAPCTPDDFRKRLEHILQTLHVTTRLLTRESPGEADLVERDARAYARFLEVLQDTTELLSFQDRGKKSHPLRFYFEHLRMAVERERYNVREQFGRGVLVTSIDETRGLSLDVMIVAGLVDGEFPSVYQQEVFFSAARQKQREQRYIWQNRYHFYQAITNWSEHLYLTYPEREGEIELVRSSFVDALFSIADVECWNTRNEIPFDSSLGSEEEFLRWCAATREIGVTVPEPASAAMRWKMEEVFRTTAIEQSRVKDHRLPEFEGLIVSAVSAETRSALAQLRERTYSVSQLETYAQCPFRYFAERLLLLNVAGELDEEFTPREKGTILHEALCEFYTARRDRGLPPLMHSSEAEFEEAVRDLTQIVTRKLEQLEIPDPFWEVDKASMLGNHGTGRSLIRAILEADRSRNVQSEPRYFEVVFGGAAGVGAKGDRILSTQEPVMIGDLKIRGKVDRVDVGKDFFTIVDYKTGSVIPGIGDVRDGLSLQLAVYLYAVDRLLHPALAPAGAVYFQLRDPVKLRLGLGAAAYNNVAFEVSPRSQQLLKDEEELRAVIGSSLRVVGEAVAGIAGGRFPLTRPENIRKVCVYCEYKMICRIQTLRQVQPASTEEP